MDQLFIAVGLLGVGAGIAAFSVGKVFASALTAVSRNPSFEKEIFGSAVLGAALVESLGLMPIVVIFLMLFLGDKFANIDLIGIGLLGLGAGISSLGVGSVFASLLEASSKNPNFESRLKNIAILGAALAEGLGLIVVVVILLIMFVKA